MDISIKILKSTEFAFNMCTLILLLCCIFYFYCVKRPQKARSHIFAVMLFNLLLTTISELLTIMLDYATVDGLDPILSHYVLQHIYFFLHMMLAPLFCFYLMLVNGRAVNRKPFFYILYFLPVIVVEVLVCMNPSKHWIFFYDSSDVFHRGFLEFYLYVLAGLYMLFVFFQMFSFVKVLTKVVNIAFWVFMLLSVFGIGVQYFKPDYKVELFFEALSLLGMMIIIESEDSLIDVTTRVYNQRAFVVDNEKLISTKHEYTLMTLSFTNLRFYSKMLRVVTMDNLIHSLAMWIKSVTKKNDTLYRIGTSSFAIISFGDDERTELTMKKITDKFNDEYLFNGMHFSFNVMMTKVNIPEDFQKVEAILELAEMPNVAETQGVQILRSEDLAFLKKKAEVEEMIKNALDRDRIEVYYQPIWSSETGKIRWCEALVRLNDTELGIITPDNFVEIAEQTGQIVDVGNVVFDKVCTFLRRERPQRYGLDYVEVNLSTYQLLIDETVIHFRRTLAKTGVQPEQINLEITESASFHESEALARNIQRLRDVGFNFSLDDFGTGYSNLTYVINTEFENIKSDKGLLWDVDNYKSRVLLLETIKMMRSLGMNVVQEGVETKEQLDLVVTAGANKIQGYYFGKPMPSEEFMSFLDQFNGPFYEN